MEGVYTNTDVAATPQGVPVTEGLGVYNPTVKKPVVLRTEVRWNDVYNYDGTGLATGSSGIILWDSTQIIVGVGATPQYKHIGFTWADALTAGGATAGFTANAVINLNPFTTPILRPANPIDLTEWVELEMVWSVNASGQQSVEYFVNEESIGTQQLPVALSNLSLEMWNDNQVPQFTANGFEVTFLSPEADQYFDINKVVVKNERRD